MAGPRGFEPRTSGFGGKQLTTLVVGLAIRAEMSLIIAREGIATGAIGSEFLSIAATAVFKIGSTHLAMAHPIDLHGHLISG